MNVAKLGKNGLVSVQKAVLEALQLDGGCWLIVDTTDDGANVLRPAEVAPIELDDDACIAAILGQDELPADLTQRVEAALATLRCP